MTISRPDAACAANGARARAMGGDAVQMIDAAVGAQPAVGLCSRPGLSRLAGVSPRRRLLMGGASVALHLAVLGAILAVPHRPPHDAATNPAQVAVVMVASLSPAELPPEAKPAAPVLSVPDAPPPAPQPAQSAAASPTLQPQPPPEPMSASLPAEPAPPPLPQPASGQTPPPPAPPADEPVPVVLPVPPPPPEAPSPNRRRSEVVAHAPAARVPVRREVTAANPEPPPAPAASPQAVALPARILNPSDLGAYRECVAAHLKAYQHYPETARMRREEGLVVVNVTIQRDGQIVSMSIQHGSGSPLLDESALATLKRADPLPAMPADLPGATMALLFPLRFHLE